MNASAYIKWKLYLQDFLICKSSPRHVLLLLRATIIEKENQFFYSIIEHGLNPQWFFPLLTLSLLIYIGQCFY